MVVRSVVYDRVLAVLALFVEEIVARLFVCRHDNRRSGGLVLTAGLVYNL